MHKKYFNSIVLIRLWALSSRFLLIGLAAIELTASDFGQWSLVLTTITLLSYIIGLDLYVPAVRALYEAKARTEATTTLSALALIYGLNFCLVCLALLGSEQFKIFTVGSTPLLLVLPLLLFEHLSADANRQLNLLGQLKQANVVLLIRSSLPVVVFGICCLAGKNNLSNLLLSQLIGTGVALWPACHNLKRYINEHFCSTTFSSVALTPPVQPMVRKLLQGCGLVFLTTCFLKAGQALDRQFLATLADMPRVGAYALTMAASSAIASAIDAVLISTSISKLLAADRAMQISIHQHLRRRLLHLSSALHFSALAAFIIVKLSISQTKYDFNLTEVAVLLAASLISNYSLADAALLFSLKKDKVSLWAAMVGLVALCLTILLLKNSIGANAVACGVFVSAVCTWLARKFPVDSICANRYKPLPY